MILCHFKEKTRIDQAKLLNKVFAQQESAHDELWAGAYKVFDVQAVPFVHWHCNLSSHCFYPFSLQVFPPLWELMKAANVIQHDLEFLVICQRKFCNQDPCKKVDPGQTEMVEIVPLHTPPTMCYGKSLCSLF